MSTRESNVESVDEHVARKYTVLGKLGRGAYAVVFKAVVKKHKCETDPTKRNPPCPAAARKSHSSADPCPNAVVALKKIFDAFQNETDAQRTFREIMYLQALTNHDNIIRLQNVLKAKNDLDIYLVFEYMKTDLHSVIRGDILEPVHKQYIVYQLLKALKFIHSGDLVHRDLKPCNLLLNGDCHLKLADFGLARSLKTLKSGDATVLTDYVATRWYRAPEILLGATSYTKAIDMWAVGCIVAEMYKGKAILPGSSTMNQIELILHFNGPPTAEDVSAMNSKYAHTVLGAVKRGQPADLAEVMRGAPPEATDIVRQLMHFDPRKRLVAHVDEGTELPPPLLAETATDDERAAAFQRLDALNHSYVAQFARDDEGKRHYMETVCPGKLEVPADRVDDIRFTVDEYRGDLYRKVVEAKKSRSMREMLYFRLRGLSKGK